MTDLPHLALPIGDPAGIGPEVMLKALSAMRHASGDADVRMTLVGHRSVLEQTYQQLQASSDCAHPRSLPLISPDDLDILEPDLSLTSGAIQSGCETATSGAASFAYLNRAIDLCLEGSCHGIVTAPISKTAWQLAGHHYPGQTELLAERAGVSRYGMMFVARSPHNSYELRTLLATTHIPLAAVSTTLTPELMTWKLELLIHTLQTQFRIAQPTIAIAGLNPHSGENGHLGREEADWLTSWLHTAQARYPYVKLHGLIPPDTLWVNPGRAWFAPSLPDPEKQPCAELNRGCDAYLALYHDQGLIPVKLLAFDRAVNTTIGLPFVRTSPDHGTAFNIAGRGVAEASSTFAALKLAAKLVQP